MAFAVSIERNTYAMCTRVSEFKLGSKVFKPCLKEAVQEAL